MMTIDPGPAVQAAQERLQQIATEANRNHERYIAVRAGIDAAEATETTDDGAITVTVGSAGELRDLRLSDKAMRLGPDRLSAQVLIATRRAQSRIADRVQEIVSENVPADDLLGRQIVAKARERFPEPPTEQPPARRAAPPPPQDPDDFSTRSYLGM